MRIEKLESLLEEKREILSKVTTEADLEQLKKDIQTAPWESDPRTMLEI